MNKLIASAAAVAVMSLAACSSAGSQPQSPNEIPTVQQAASKIGATDVRPYKPGPMASGYADAQWHGKSVTIATFATTGLENQWVSLAGMGTTVLWKGDLFAVVANPGR